jgi:hypothetical protein
MTEPEPPWSEGVDPAVPVFTIIDDRPTKGSEEVP